jgi:hypothetical protein
LSGIAISLSAECWYRAQDQKTIPTKIPTNCPAVADYGRTAAKKSRVKLLILLAFRTPANICERAMVPRGGIEPATDFNDLAASGTLFHSIGSLGFLAAMSHL